MPLSTALAISIVGSEARAYPTDDAAQKHTKLRRLKWQHDVDNGEYRGRKTKPGGRWPMERIKLRMLQARDFDVTIDTPKDPELQAGLEKILKTWRWRRYNIALLDITDPRKPRYAAINETAQQTPASTAKVLLGTALMNALKERFGDDIEARKKLLQETMISADDWAMPNSHEVPVILGDVYGKKYRTWIRAVRHGDTFSLWEWMDHALSPSSNASASTMWREATLIRLLGDEYPPEERDAELWKRWDKEAFTKAVFDAVDKPLIDAGLNIDDFYIRLFFTHGAGKYINGGGSRASPLGLLRWMLRVEQGRMVDEWSSLELKRMIYLTRRRIRYTYTPVLNDSAVFFKTGSLYRCKPEKGYRCRAYQGNYVNILNAIVGIETPPPETEKDVAPVEKSEQVAAHKPIWRASPWRVRAAGLTDGDDTGSNGSRPHVYMIAVMSNELKRNAAMDHGRLAAEIHKLILGK